MCFFCAKLRERFLDLYFKMLRDQRGRDLPPKQEGNINIDDHKAPTTSARLWSGLKNPRIVRVSRAFGGKDRHSKVSTIRGLRDRRVRLSVPTAIQLYDLQDRLGLNQPSKVVDWLINAAQHEIDKLPPLQIPPESFAQFSQSNEAPLAAKSFGFLNENASHKANASENWSSDALQRIKQRDDQTKKTDELKSGTNDEHLQRSSIPSFLSNTVPFSSYYQLEASNAYFSQFGGRNSFTHYEAPLLCPQGMMPPMFSSYVANPNEFDARLQMASSVSQNPRNSLQLGSPSTRPFE